MTVAIKTPLNLLSPVDYTFDLKGVTTDNEEKSFENGLTINDSHFLKNIISTSEKSNSKFYLKDFALFGNSFNIESNEFLSDILTTPLIFDGLYVNFKSFDNDFFALSGDYDSYLSVGEATLSAVETLVTISLSGDNRCTLFIEKDGKFFNLVSYDDGVCIFNALESPTIFSYLYSSERQQMTFSTVIGGVSYFLTRNGQDVVLEPLNNENKAFFLDNSFSISKQIFSNNTYPTNSRVIDYNNDLSINNSEENFNNQLLHRTDGKISIISLKNVTNQNGTFSSTANSLSSSSKFKVSGIRRYTSINSDISRKNDNELSINYVFGNQEYLIKPGKNTFTTPEELYPYEKINVNDTFFIECGAYASQTPTFSDRIYKYDDNTTINKQHLLCTWLSGNGSESLWVDRYYYPDLISKEQALSGDPIFYSTYKNEIEMLISDNSNLRESITNQSYFDKMSDMCFSPNEMYVYDRINVSRFEELSAITYNPCDFDTNYFKNINVNGAFEMSFYFEGDASTWSLSSKRNDINGGVIFTKNTNSAEISLALYDPSSRTFETFSDAITFKPQETNFLAVSVDALNGIGYFLINETLVRMFNFRQAQYINKNILFGNFVIPDDVSNFRIYPRYKSPKDIGIYPILDGIEKIDDITISLPSGTRNSVDVIEIIQNICDSASFKSNTINITINNIDLIDDDLNTLKAGIRTNSSKNLPITMEIRDINTD